MLVFVNAKGIVDCRVVTGSITECNPYGSKFLRAKEIKDEPDRQKLIVVKREQASEKKSTIKVVSVAEMMEKYVKRVEPLRFKESRQGYLKVSVAKETVAPKVEEETTENIIEEVTEEEFELDEEFETETVVVKEKPSIEYGRYTVVKGDALSRIAKKFGIKTEELAKLNKFKKKSTIRIGQKLKIPLPKNMTDAIIKAEYKVENGDTLISIAKKFNLSVKALDQFNHIKNNTMIRAGKVLLLPLPYKVAQLERKKRAQEKRKKLALQKRHKKTKMIRSFGKHSLRVTATAYTSHKSQTDSTPFLAAWNNRLRPGMKIIAVSRDMLTRYGMRNGTKVHIGGLSGYYRVRDKMNKRYRKRIDIYMGVDIKKALRWGRRSVMIYW